MEDLMFPTLHNNGTSYEELIRQLENASRALDDALAALTNAAPNARDYYVRGQSAFLIAAQQHNSRVSAVKAVQVQITDIWMAIQDQEDERKG